MRYSIVNVVTGIVIYATVLKHIKSKEGIDGIH